MERLSKSERIGLLAFASVALIFILVSYSMKTDTLMPVVTRKKKHSKPVADINPFDDEMERQD